MNVSPSRPFLRAAGVAGVVAGVITAAIVVLPWIHGEPRTLAERVELHTNPLYMLRLWLSFLNVFAILFASWGLAASRLRHSPGAASTGMLLLLFYGAAELLGRSTMIFAREYNWTHASIITSNDEHRMALLQAVERFDEVWAGLFVLILISFTLSAALFGWATRGGSRLQRATSGFLFAAAGLGLVTFVAGFVPQLRSLASWGYPVVQPASRVLIGVFLLAEARGAHSNGANIQT